jgi:hypothetical protein
MNERKRESCTENVDPEHMTEEFDSEFHQKNPGVIKTQRFFKSNTSYLKNEFRRDLQCISGS